VLWFSFVQNVFAHREFSLQPSGLNAGFRQSELFFSATMNHWQTSGIEVVDVQDSFDAPLDSCGGSDVRRQYSQGW
jgi:hypothetical protein